MNRRGETTPIQLVMGFVIAIAVVILIITIYVKFFDKSGTDIDSFSACEARGVHAGGRGECSTDQTCARVTVDSSHYAWYLGTSCPVEEGAPPQYCCVIIPKSRNPPALPTQGPNANQDVNIPGQTSPLLELRYRLLRTGAVAAPLAQEESRVLAGGSISGLELTTTFARKDGLACQTLVETTKVNADGTTVQDVGAVFTQCDGFFDFAANGLPVFDGGGVAYMYEITTTMTSAGVAQPLTVQGSMNRGVDASGQVDEFHGKVIAGVWKGCSDANSEKDKLCTATFADGGVAYDTYVYNGRTITGTTYICQINRITGACTYTPAGPSSGGGGGGGW